MQNYTFRPSQEAILAYTGGKLGIAAVPGSGKTFVLSALAADLISRGELDSEQEVLVVTLVNSAVENFSARISSFIEARGLLPRLGYRVRTLHGLAHDIVREKPEKVGLEERFAILDEREADFIRKEAAQAWLTANPGLLDDYLSPELDDRKRDWVRRSQLPDLVQGLALAFIRSAKDRRLAPDDLRRRLDQAPAPLPLAEMGWAIYADYQRALTYRGAVDFDDLIRLALDLLESDLEFLERLRFRWPYILEDEAQDSSQLQEQILRLLAGENGNWVRVGDPNQAIFETFTTASPRYLRAFIAGEADFQRELPELGPLAAVDHQAGQFPGRLGHEGASGRGSPRGAGTSVHPAYAKGRSAAEPSRRPGRYPFDRQEVRARRGDCRGGRLAREVVARKHGGDRGGAGAAQHARCGSDRGAQKT